MIEPKTPSTKDSIVKILKEVCSPVQSAKPDSLFTDGKFVKYTGENKYIQDVYTYILFSNESIASNRIFNELTENEKGNFFKEGYFVSTDSGWNEIPESEFWAELKKYNSFKKVI